MSPRKQQVANKRLRLIKPPPEAPKKPLIYMVSTGTPNQMTEPKGFASEKWAKNAAIDFFQSQRAMTVRLGLTDSAKAIDDAVEEIQRLPVFLHTRRRVSRVLDVGTGFTMTVDLWKEDE